MCMKPNKAGNNIWLGAQIGNQKFKRNALIHDANGMQFFYALCMTQLEAMSQQRNYQ